MISGRLIRLENLMFLTILMFCHRSIRDESKSRQLEFELKSFIHYIVNLAIDCFSPRLFCQRIFASEFPLIPNVLPSFWLPHKLESLVSNHVATLVKSS